MDSAVHGRNPYCFDLFSHCWTKSPRKTVELEHGLFFFLSVVSYPLGAYLVALFLILGNLFTTPTL